MSNFEQTRSEKNRGNTSTATRIEVSNAINERIASEQRRKESEERLAERANRVGTSKTRIATLIIMGSTDRVNAVPYDPNKFESKYDQEAYKEGFIYHGNREILGKMGELTDEQLKKIGTNDYVSGLALAEIPKKLKENEAYTVGQVMGPLYSEKSEKQEKQNKKHR